MTTAFPYITVDAYDTVDIELVIWLARTHADVLYVNYHCDVDFHVRLFLVRRRYAPTSHEAFHMDAEYDAYMDKLCAQSIA